DDDFEKLAALTSEYRKIRKYFSKDFYSYGADAYDTTSWTIWQYHDKSDDSGILMAFRRSESPFDSATLKLKGLNENKNYSYYNFDTKEEKVGNNSLTVNLSEKRTSVVIEYRGK
nr:GH36 C-terminal domain-containing protein [Bacillota bacterium]